MLAIHNSTAKVPNRKIRKKTRTRSEDNLDWLSRHLPSLLKRYPGPRSAILLVGGSDTVSARLRGAQARARQDLSPSHWSHVALLDLMGKHVKAVTTEISLMPVGGFGFPAPVNALQQGSIRAYQDAKTWPNIAVLLIPVDQHELVKHLERLKGLRSTIDLCALTLQWLSYLWGTRDAPNPLVHDTGVPSAVMLEYAVGSLGFDLTPGLTSRSSCPEAIWQAAKWWHEFHSQTDQASAGKAPAQQPIAGIYTIKHRLP